MTSVLARRAFGIAGILAANLFMPLSFGAQAVHQPDEGAVTLDFQYRPADLATQRGAHGVLRTLVYKATRACTDSGEAPLSLRRVDSGCVTSLVDRAVRQIGSETLAHEWKNMRPSTPGVALAQVMK